MIKLIPRYLRQPSACARDTAGAGTIELALILPVILILTFGTIDLSMWIASKLDLEQAAQRTTDFALSSRPRSASGSYLVNEAKRSTGLPDEQIKVEIFLECGGVKDVDFNAACPPGLYRARYVSVRIEDTLDPVVNWAGLANAMGFGGQPGPIIVVGDSLVRFQ